MQGLQLQARFPFYALGSHTILHIAGDIRAFKLQLSYPALQTAVTFLALDFLLSRWFPSNKKQVASLTCGLPVNFFRKTEYNFKMFLSLVVSIIKRHFSPR